MMAAPTQSVTTSHATAITPGGSSPAPASLLTPPSSTPQRGPTVIARSAADILAATYPPTVYTVDGFLPVGLTVLAGSQKVGKSWMFLQLAQAVATGATFLGMETRRGRVLYLALEDNEPRIQRRLQRQGALAGLEDLRIVTRFDGTIDDLRTYIDEWVAEDPHNPPALVIVDTLGRIMIDRPGNSNEYHHSVRELAKLQQAAFDHDLSVVVANHKRKAQQNGSGDPFEEMMGSTGIAATADASILVDKKRLSTEGTIQTVSRDAEERLIEVTFDATTCCWFIGAVDPMARLGVKGRLADVVKVIGDATVASKDIQEALGIASNQVSDLITKGEDAKVVKRVGQGKYQLSEGALAILREGSGSVSMGSELSEHAEHRDVAPDDTCDTHPGFEF